MIVKLLGSMCILLVCGGLGYHLAWECHQEEMVLRQLRHVMEYMECALQYQQTPLPTLCRQCSAEVTGIISSVFSQLADKLDSQILPDVYHCMRSILKRERNLTSQVSEVLEMLGKQLGKFDLDGQVRSISNVKEICNKLISDLDSNKDVRIRRYKTLGICAGAALIIVFI